MTIQKIRKSMVNSIASAALGFGVALIALTTVGVSEARADKLCVSSDKKQVVKVPSGGNCTSFIRDADGVGMNDNRWKNATEKSCEEFETENLTWSGLNLCADLKTATSIREDFATFWTVYPSTYSDTKKTRGIVGGGKCNANSCTYGVTASASKSVNKATSAKLGTISVTVDIGVASSSGQSLSCTWLNGEIPGIQITDAGKFTDTSKLTYLKCFTAGFANVEANKQIFDNKNDCPSTDDIKIDGKTYKKGALTTVGKVSTTYASAKESYDIWIPHYKQRNNTVFKSGTKLYYVCSAKIFIDVPGGAGKFREPGTLSYKWTSEIKRRALTLKN